MILCSPKTADRFGRMGKMKGWHYVTYCRTYLYGNESEGCGVFPEKDKWCGHVVYDDRITKLSYFDTIEEAKKAAIETLEGFRKM